MSHSGKQTSPTMTSRRRTMTTTRTKMTTSSTTLTRWTMSMTNRRCPTGGTGLFAGLRCSVAVEASRARRGSCLGSARPVAGAAAGYTTSLPTTAATTPWLSWTRATGLRATVCLRRPWSLPAGGPGSFWPAGCRCLRAHLCKYRARAKPATPLAGDH